MAALASPPPVYRLTSPSSQQSLRGMWEYAVPLDHDENDDNAQPRIHGPHPSRSAPDKQLQTISASPNPHQSPVLHTNDSISSRQFADAQVTSPTWNNAWTRPQNMSYSAGSDGQEDLSRAGSDGPVGQSSWPSFSNPGKMESPPSMSPSSAPPERDESKWIHRDKLAQIESKELAEAGIRLDHRISGRPDDDTVNDKKQRRTSPVRDQSELNLATANDTRPFEKEASLVPKPVASKPVALRVGVSKIPVARNFSSPINHSDREYIPPGSRSRDGSVATNSAYSVQSPANQLNSQSSAPDGLVQDEYSLDTSPTRINNPGLAGSSDSQSLKKIKAPPRITPVGKRPTISPPRQSAATARSRTTTPIRSTPEIKRPRSSNSPSSITRPLALNRPEGDPPWIATMYKPDPRLPPEQQMLPTHAKRLAQARWEKEGKIGTIYDKEFNLLNTQEFSDNPANDSPTKMQMPSPKAEDDLVPATLINSKWPNLSSPPMDSPKSQNSFRPGTGGTDRANGGYKTMPTITPAALTTLVPVQSIRLPEPIESTNEKKKQKKLCCFSCVVM